MPKILINEKDYTNPGSPDSYSNYSVLVAGFKGSGDGKTVAPDSNGVYEFHKLQDFIDTIGEVAPEYVYSNYEKKVTVFQYGNLMARELLAMGYPVVYLPINPSDGVGILANENTWEIFKDKVSYDFRFITHGLLKSGDTAESDAIKARNSEIAATPSWVYSQLKPIVLKMAKLASESAKKGWVLDDGHADKAFWDALKKELADYDIDIATDATDATTAILGLLSVTDDTKLADDYDWLKNLGVTDAHLVAAEKYDELSAEKRAILQLAYERLTVEESSSDYPKIINPATKEKYTTLRGLFFGYNDASGKTQDIGIFAEKALNEAMLKLYITAGDTEDKDPVTGLPVPVEGELKLGADGKEQRKDNKVLVTITTVDDSGEETDTEEYVDVVMIDDGLISKVNAHIANLASYVADKTSSGRGDCIALIELDENVYVSNTAGTKPESSIITAINKQSGINAANGKYCAMTVPSVVYADGRKFPGAFHYLACFMNSLMSGFAEWYAAAGYTRGVSSYRIKNTTVTLGEIAINALEPRNTDGSATSPKFACNVIANFRGSFYLWGNRTAEPLGDVKGTEGDLKASHFLNIRQLCTTIKKQLFVACRRFTFDPNSDTLWFNFVNAIRPTLEAMKADQGVRDYKILKIVEANPKKATLKAKIRLIPIEAVEDFDIEVSLEDSFGETAVNTSESV